MIIDTGDQPREGTVVRSMFIEFEHMEITLHLFIEAQ